MAQFVTLEEARSLPFWRRPVALLFLMAVAMPIAFSVWVLLLNNFVVEIAQFDGFDISLLHFVREIPGFLAVGVIAILLFMREQVLGLISLLMLGVATALTAQFPELGGLLFLTLISSIGFHYYETVNQSLQLQWLKIEDAPRMIGWLMAAGSFATILAYVLIINTWKMFDLSYNFVYMTAGLATVVIAVFAMLAYPQFEAPTPQNKRMVLRRRYWLYYALQFIAGGRRQIFMIFAAFMMVEKFGFEVHEMAGLYLVNLVISMIAAPIMGRVVSRYGERKALGVEYVGLICVFMAYGGVHYFGWGFAVAATLYVLDHIFFALALALKTYFQKIADPADIAPTAAVAFTINHIAAVALPLPLGLLWLASPAAVFVFAAAMAAISLCLAMMIPRHPAPGNETIFARVAPQAAE